jgi:hypothetical protein
MAIVAMRLVSDCAISEPCADIPLTAPCCVDAGRAVEQALKITVAQKNIQTYKQRQMIVMIAFPFFFYLSASFLLDS